MLLQDFIKAAQMRQLEVIKAILPSMATSLSPLQWKICNFIVEDVASDRL
jgi:hypothetical protein